jgi:hypothetical protein
MKMYPNFDVEGIALDDLLREWRWLVAGNFSLLAVNAFGDLFLADTHGRVYRLDITAGTVSEVASTLVTFRQAVTRSLERMTGFLKNLLGRQNKGASVPGKVNVWDTRFRPCSRRAQASPTMRTWLTSTNTSRLWATSIGK